MTKPISDKRIVTIARRVVYISAVLIGSGILFLLAQFNIISFDSKTIGHDYVFYMNYDVSTLSDSPENSLIKLGYQVFTETNKHIGPDSNQKITGNRLACTNCHLNGCLLYTSPSPRDA